MKIKEKKVSEESGKICGWTPIVDQRESRGLRSYQRVHGTEKPALMINVLLTISPSTDPKPPPINILS